MQTIRQWLEQLGLEQYAEVFARNDVDLEALRLLTEGDLEKLGVSLGNRKKLLSAIARFDGSARPVGAADTPFHLQSTPTEAERRQLTVMFCDLVESTALSQRLDPEDYREVVRAYQAACTAAITMYDGHIAQHLGDGLLVYFGYPKAHEDDAQRAVRAGLELIDAVGRLSLTSGPIGVRVGIHTGLVVVGEVGTGSTTEQLALGDTPNIAARIQGLAQVNEVVVSATTEKLLARLFQSGPLGARTLKGVERPVECHRILSANPARTSLDAKDRFTALVGRDQDLGLLVDRWERACEGQGQVVLLTGEPGIGKSRLVRALRERLAGTERLWIETRCSPYFTQTPLYPIVEALPRLLEWTAGDSSEAELRKLEEVIVKCDIDPIEAVPLLAILLARPTPAQYPLPPMTPVRERRRTLETIVALLLGLAGKRPLLLAIEDLHWIDPTALELIGQLLDQVASGNLLLVLTARPEFSAPWGSRSYIAALTLNRPTRRQTEQVVAQLAGEATLPQELAREIVERTDGVPLFIEELTKSVLESGMVEQVDGGYRLTDRSTALTIPATLQDSLMARLDRLHTAKETAQLAATVGRAFRYAWLRALSPLDEAALQRALKQLADAELLYQRGQPPDATYTFKHALIQDAAYQSLLKSKRQQYHRLIGQTFLERFPDEVTARPELVAHHFSEAALHLEAAHYWLIAGERALQRSAQVEAIAHLNAGLAALAQSTAGLEGDRIELQIQIVLGAAAIFARGYADAEVGRAFGRAHELAEHLQDAPSDVMARMGLWVCHLVRGDLDLSHDIAEQCRHLARGLSSDLQIQSLTATGCNSFWMGHLSAAREDLEFVLSKLELRSDATRVDWMYHDLEVANRLWLMMTLWALGYADQSILRCEQGLRVSEALQRPLSRAFMLQHAAFLHNLRRDWALAEQFAAECITLSQDQGLPFFHFLGLIHRGRALFHLGQEKLGLATLHDGISAFRTLGDRVGLPYFEGALAEALAANGRPQEGLPMVDGAIAQLSGVSSHWCTSELLRIRGEILLRIAKPDVSGAEASFLDAIRIARVREAKALELRGALALARLWKQQGRTSEARQLLAPVYNWFTEGFDTKDLQEANVLLEELA